MIFFDALGVKVRDGALVRNKAALKLMWLALMEDAIAWRAAEGAGGSHGRWSSVSWGVGSRDSEQSLFDTRDTQSPQVSIC